MPTLRDLLIQAGLVKTPPSRLEHPTRFLSDAYASEIDPNAPRNPGFTQTQDDQGVISFKPYTLSPTDSKLNVVDAATRDIAPPARFPAPSKPNIQPEQFNRAVPQSVPRSFPQVLSTDTSVPNTTPIVRPTQPLQPVPADPNAPFGSSGEPFGSTRLRRTQPRDYVADDMAYARDLENKPHSKVLDILSGITQGAAALGGNAPAHPVDFSGRDKGIRDAFERIGRELGIQKEQAQIRHQDIMSQQGQLVPMQLPDGTMVQVPAGKAGQYGMQAIGLNERHQMNLAHQARWGQMAKHERAADIMKLYNSGGANDPELLTYMSKALDLPAELQPKFVSGEIVPKDLGNGNIGLINKRTQEVIDTGEKSMASTLEEGRNLRRDKNAADAMARTQTIVRAGVAKMGDVPDLEKTQGMLNTYADEKDQEAKEILSNPDAGKSDKARAAKLQSEATQYRLHAGSLGEAIGKAKGAQSGAGKIGANEDPQIRDYANKHFGGNYQKALDYARKTGYRK